jgi:hypothetical protein
VGGGESRKRFLFTRLNVREKLYGEGRNRLVPNGEQSSGISVAKMPE